MPATTPPVTASKYPAIINGKKFPQYCERDIQKVSHDYLDSIVCYFEMKALDCQGSGNDEPYAVSGWVKLNPCLNTILVGLLEPSEME